MTAPASPGAAVGGFRPGAAYEEKFAPFLNLLQLYQAGGQIRMLSPEVLGTTYADLVESLNRLADAGVSVLFMPRETRCGSRDSACLADPAVREFFKGSYSGKLA